MHTWQIHAAKARFSEVIRCAKLEGPQEITQHGQPVAVMISRELYAQLAGQTESLVDFMARSPLREQGEDEELVFERDHSLPREISF